MPLSPGKAPEYITASECGARPPGWGGVRPLSWVGDRGLQNMVETGGKVSLTRRGKSRQRLQQSEEPLSIFGHRIVTFFVTRN